MYTVEFSSVVTRPISHIVAKSDNCEIECQALWDTGSNQTCISPIVAANLGLKAIRSFSATRVGGNITGSKYKVCLEIDDDIKFNNLTVCTVLKDWRDHQILIGMDIISQGTLTIDNSTGHTILSFALL